MGVRPQPPFPLSSGFVPEGGPWRRPIAVKFPLSDGPKGPYTVEMRTSSSDCHLTDAARLLESGRFAEARAEALAQLEGGAARPLVEAELHEVAGLASSQLGDMKAASLHLEQCAGILERELGADHPDLANILGTLARAYDRLGRYAEAEPLLLRALSLREKALGAQHPRVATYLREIAGLFLERGRHVEAEALCLRALAIQERVLGPENPRIGPILDDLAGICEASGRASEAERFRARSRSLGVRRHGAGE